MQKENSNWESHSQFKLNLCKLHALPLPSENPICAAARPETTEPVILDSSLLLLYPIILFVLFVIYCRFWICSLISFITLGKSSVIISLDIACPVLSPFLRNLDGLCQTLFLHLQVFFTFPFGPYLISPSYTWDDSLSLLFPLQVCLILLNMTLNDKFQSSYFSCL